MKERIITGKIKTIRKGLGFIDDPNDAENNIVIESDNLNYALNGDTVEVSIIDDKNNNLEKTGKVISVIERARTTFVGTVEERDKKFGVIPDDKKLYIDFMLIGEEAEKVTSGDKVQLELGKWTDSKKNPEAKILRVIGKKGNNNAEMESIVLEKGFDTSFPVEVEREAEEIEKNEKKISEEEIKKRKDIRNVLTFTIDPFDAKDFDDAISFREIEKDKKGHTLYEIGVHIADVSHYVREGTALDDEAKKRGCSIYLVDRTIPMLPEVLSNDVCSLNPHEDKLSFSAIFNMNEEGEVLERWFGKTIMNSDHRFTYETAQETIDKKTGPYLEELEILNKIAKVLQKEKFKMGAIEFEQEEIKFKLDENGKPIGVYKKERLDTHKLVEEYMLLANREVAKYIYDAIKSKGKKDTGSIYRIHDIPDQERMLELSNFVKALGYVLHTKEGKVTAHDIKYLLKQVEGTPHEALIRTAAIRSMQKAIYSTKNIGHFGLAFEYYTHFTSPIRRYPDLLVHRVLFKHLNHIPFGDREIVEYQHIAEASTDREIDAAEAERASKKLKQVEYMSDKIGQVFEGTISGVTEWGIYIEEIETKSEGMIKLRDLGTDFYVFDKKTYSIVGEKNKKRFTLGDKIKFKVVAADLDRKTLDFAPV
ncbi:MAG TPA: ribonuclease R [Candidatus Paceibacterota bacterium]